MNIAGELLICLIFAILHEVGHTVAIIAFSKTMPNSITITPFGMNIEIDKFIKVKTFQKVIISFAGPLVNLCIFMIYFFLLNENSSEMQRYCMFENLILFSFNLLPIVPLDGGEIVFELLSQKFELEMAEKISDIISMLVIIPIFSLGFYYLLNSHGNYFLLFIAIYLIFLLVLRRKH